MDDLRPHSFFVSAKRLATLHAIASAAQQKVEDLRSMGVLPPLPPGPPLATLPELERPLAPASQPRRGRGRPRGRWMPGEFFVTQYPLKHQALCRELDRLPTAEEMTRALRYKGFKIHKSTLFRYLGDHPELRAQYPLRGQRS